MKLSGFPDFAPEIAFATGKSALQRLIILLAFQPWLEIRL